MEAHAEDKVDWLEARNICREYCMDLTSIETPSENDLINDLITGGKQNKFRVPQVYYSMFVSHTIARHTFASTFFLAHIFTSTSLLAHVC